MSFDEAVKQIPSVKGCFKNGLQAMGGDSALIRMGDTRKFDGSVAIDTCLEKIMAQDSRWDYAIGYNGKAYFVEVHPASGQVSDVIAKCAWMRMWLKADGAPLAAIHGDGVFHWISTGKVKIIGKEKARLAKNKIIINSLKLQ